MIPKFLIIGGSFLVLKLSLSIRQQAQEPKIYEDNHCYFDCYVITEKAISLFLFIWFLLGNIWIFSHANNRAIWQDSQSNLHSPCNLVLYKFSYNLIILIYIFYGLLSILTIVIAIYATLTLRKCKEAI